ncbi:MAG: hypothetical protein ABC596_09335 [Candidatus Methanosuratincola petrocarbonis]
MTYLTDELRGIDAALSDLRQRVASLEAALADLKKSIPVRYATERQKSFIHDICKVLNLPYPDGYPNRITFQQASEFIEAKQKFFYDAKRAQGQKQQGAH